MSKRKALSSNNRTYLAMTIPIVILFFLFNTLPLITGAVYSFTNYRGYGTVDFVGQLFEPVAGNGAEQQDPLQEPAPRCVLCPEYSGRTDRRLYFQLYLYLHHSGCGQCNAHRLSGKQYSCQ